MPNGFSRRANTVDMNVRAVSISASTCCYTFYCMFTEIPSMSRFVDYDGER